MTEKKELWRWTEGRWTSPDIDWKGKLITSGVDVGSVSSQAVILADGELYAFSNMRTGSNSPDSAINAINWNDHENPLVEPKVLVDTDTFQCQEILKCEYFQLEKLTFTAPLEVPMSGKTFHALFIAEGEATISWGDESFIAPAGTSILVPAALPAYTLDGNTTVLRTTIP